MDFASQIKKDQPRDFASKLNTAKQSEENDVAFLGQIDTSGGRPGMRFSLSRGDTFEEKQRIFKKKFPQGELVRIPVSGKLAFKENSSDPNERFKTVERSDLKSGNLTELTADVGEFVGENAGPIIGEIAASRLPFLRGRGILASAGAEGAGAGAGELTEQGIQELRGINTQELPEVLGQAGQEAGFSAGGAGLFSAIAKPAINIGKGAGALSQRPGAVQAEAARRSLNEGLETPIPPFTPGQIAETPVLQRLDEQSIALAGGLRAQRRNQIAGVAQATRQAANPKDLVRVRRNAEKAFRSENRKFANAINGSGDFDDAGVALKSSLERYSKESQKQVGALYDSAAEFSPPNFDLSGPLEVSETLTRGVNAQGVDGVVNAQGALAPELTSVINDLRQIDPSFPQGPDIAPPWQVLDNLRQRLFDLKTPNAGEVFRRNHAQAAQLFKAITDTLDSPVGGNEAFQTAWNQARQAASERFGNLELSNIVRLARTDETTGFARKLVQPGSADALRQLDNVLDEKSMRQVTDAFKKDLASDLNSFSEKLSAFDPETLKRLLSPDEIKRFGEIGEGLARLDSTGIQTALQEQTRNRAFVRDLITRDDTAGVSALMETVRNNGGKNGPLAKSLRAGIVDDFFDDVVKIQVDGGSVSQDLLVARLKKINNLGLGPLLTSKERRLMKDVMNIAPFVKISRGGAGASIQAADVGENLISFGDPKSQISGIFSIIQKIGYARTMQNPAVRSLLIGGGKRQVNPNRALAVIGATLSTALTEIEEQ